MLLFDTIILQWWTCFFLSSFFFPSFSKSRLATCDLVLVLLFSLRDISRVVLVSQVYKFWYYGFIPVKLFYILVSRSGVVLLRLALKLCRIWENLIFKEIKIQLSGDFHKRFLLFRWQSSRVFVVLHSGSM